MSILFIPPPGAMQFAWGEQHVWHGESVWVQPYDGPWKEISDLKHICTCKQRFLVIRETESPRVRRLSRDGKPKVVCTCVGGIIE